MSAQRGSRLRAYAARLRGLLRRPRQDEQFDEEVQEHLRLLAERFVARGMSREEAAVAARRQFGNTTLLHEDRRALQTLPSVESLWRDLRYALRTLRRSPGFTAVAILTLGLGLGACTAIYTVVYGVLLRPLPYPQSDRIMQLWQITARTIEGRFSDPNYDDLRDQNRTFASMAAFYENVASVTGGASAVRVTYAGISRDVLTVLRAQPRLGRAFTPDEHVLGANPAILVGDRFWREQLGGNPDLSGVTLKFHNRTWAVIGVMPPEFRFPADAQLWVPRELEPPYASRTAHNWRVVGRLRDGVTIDQARSDLRGIAQRLKQQYGEGTTMVDVAVVPLHDQIVGRVRRLLLTLLGAVGFLLLVACANVFNLLLTRATTRQRELAVRAALGASRVRLLTPFLGESFVLTAAGGLLGVLVAFGGVRGLLQMEPGGLPRLDEIAVSWPVLAFAFAVSVVTALLLGVIAATRAMKADVFERLKEGQRTMAGGSPSARLRGALVVVQLAVSLVLLVGAGLLGRSFLHLMHQQTGFRTEHLVTMELAGQSAVMPDGTPDEASLARRIQFHEQIQARLRALPSVTEVGGIDAFPLTGYGADGWFQILDGTPPPKDVEELREMMRNKERAGSAEFRIASPGYFKTMGIPLVRGRLFEDRDTIDAPHVAVISETLAKSRWPDRDPIGLQIEYGNMDGDLRPYTIVGIVGDTRDGGFAASPRPMFYGNARQRPRRIATFTIVAHTTGDPSDLIGRAGQIVRTLNPDMPPRFHTIQQIVAGSVADRRFSLLLLSAFAGSALLLAVIGIYGVMSYVVTLRTQEMGVRMALGAKPGDIARLVLGQGVRLVVTGLVLGLIGAALLTRLLSTMLFGITPTDPVTYAMVAGVLALTAVAACQIPVWRATHVDPLTALRSE
jgi:predicted permease